MTERVVVEAALRDAKRALEDAARIKDEFLANISHEIRTPMNGVLGMVELLLATELPNDSQRYIQSIKNSASTLLRIVNGVLDFSKIEAGQMQLEPVTTDLKGLIEEIVDTFQLDAERRSLSLSASLSRNIPAFVALDPVRFQQVLINLLGNALKFTPAGAVRLEIDYVAEGPDKLQVAVHDTGVGIDSEALQRIMDPFQQADGSTTRRFGGTGLGLAISKGLVELMGGQLEVESTIGSGSTFSFSIAAPRVEPSVDTNALVNHSSNDELASFAQLRVLVADDHPVNQEISQQHLIALGCSPVAADDGDRAILLASESEFDLILMDWHMPNMDGLEATRRLRTGAAEPTTSAMVPIIAMTANAMPGDRERCVEAGMNDYISKPFTREKLVAVLQRYCGNTQSSEDAIDDKVIADFVGPNAAGSVLLNRLLEVFLRESKRDLDSLKESIEADDIPGIRQSAHRLKSSSAAVGASRMTELCDRLELAARTNKIDKPIEAYRAIVVEFSRAEQGLYQRIEAA